MNTKQQSLHISQDKLLDLVRTMIGGSRGREDDEHPLKPGPWDPIIRVALERINVFGPSPVPWKVALGGGHSSGEEVALNPQPLPPRFAFLMSAVQAVTGRAELIQEIADATLREGEQHSIVGSYISRLSDDWCGNGFRLKWPFPGPRPHWFAHELDGIDLIVMATQFEQAARETFSPGLRQNLADASTKFVEAGLSKMQ